MNDDRIRESKYAIPEANSNLKESIIDEYDNLSRAKSYKKAVTKKNRLFVPTLSCIILALIVAITTIFIPLSTDEYKSYSSTTDYSVIEGFPAWAVSGRRGSKSGDGFSSSSPRPSGEMAPSESALDSSMGGSFDDADYSESDKNYTPYIKTLTSSCVDDNEEFEYWEKLNADNFKTYSEQSAFRTLNRIKITLPKGITAKVTLINDNEAIFASIPNRNGVAYLFSNVKQNEYKIIIEYATSKTTTKTISDVVQGDKDYSEIITDGYNNHKDLIELAVVIDTTGSMGDEITFLQKELINVINTVKNDNPNTEIKVSVIAYKDQGDAQEEYLVKKFDFSADLVKVNNFLSTLYASGGGDFEEAVEVALKETTELSWSSDDSTKLCLFVADAPSHDEDIASWAKSTKTLASKGVRIIDVASSGIDTKTEYLFRSQTILTGGTYGYLTDDSGVGGSHLIASTEEKKTVEYLNDMLVRLINGYHTGIFSEAVAYNNNEQ